MKFTVLQANFARALNQVSRAVGTRTTLPVLSHILISAKKGKICLSGTDLEVAITAKAMGKIEEEGELTIPGRLLSDFVLNNNDESIDFETEENKIHLKSKHFQANITGISSEEFPTIPTFPKENLTVIPSADFAGALKKVAIAPAHDETRPVLAGVYLHFNKKKLVMAATDSYRLAEITLKLEEEVEEKKFIVPARTINEVLRLISSIDSKEIKISATENQVGFKIAETQIISRLIEGAFPNYSQIIPAGAKITVTAPHKEIVSAVKMTALFAKDSANNIKVKTKKGELIIASIATESGDSTSKVEAEVTGGQVEVAFNSRYLLDVLGVLSGEKVIIELNDESSPGVLKSPQDPDFIYIVMPLRLDQ